MKKTAIRSLAAASLAATTFAVTAPPTASGASLTPIHAQPSATAELGSTHVMSPLGDFGKWIRCMTLLWRGNRAVADMNQANQDGSDARDRGDAEAYNDALADYVAAHGRYTDARNSYNSEGCGGVTGSFPTAPGPIFV